MRAIRPVFRPLFKEWQMRIVHLDYETFSECDISHGTYAYAKHPSTEVLLAAYKVNDSTTCLWDASDLSPIPDALVNLFNDPEAIFSAFNAAFEREITKHVLGFDIPIERWRCTMVEAYYCAFSGGLGEVAKQMGLPIEKDSDGKRLIRKFCTPRTPTKKNPAVRTYPTDHLEDWVRFGLYCMRDVDVEHKMAQTLSRHPMPDSEWRNWFLDQKINRTGFPINRKFVQSATLLADKEKGRLLHLLGGFTQIENPNSGSQLLGYLRSIGYPHDNLRKDTIALYLVTDLPTDEIRTILELRQDASKSSTSKYPTILNAMCDDDRLRGTLQFAGATRTMRWAGRIAQFQNLPRPVKWIEKEVESAARIVEHARTLSDTQLYYPDLMPVLSSLIRCSVQAHDGRILNVADLASIETRVIGWLAGCKGILDVYAQGLDAYKQFATYMFRKPYNQITKEERNIAKPPVLGCFSAGTLVLSSEGWKPISEVTENDLLFDGREWVRSAGAHFMGRKRTINFHGVSVTPDHLLLTDEGEWRPVSECLRSENLNLSVMSAGRSALSDTLLGHEAGAEPIFVSVSVGPSADRPEGTSIRGGRKPARSARLKIRQRLTQFTPRICQIRSSAKCGRTGIRAFGLGATTTLTRSIKTTAVEGLRLPIGGTTRPFSSRKSRIYPAGTTRNSNWTGLITTKGTPQIMSGWLRGNNSVAILDEATGSSTKETRTQRMSSTKNLPECTDVPQLSPEKREKGRLPNKLSKNSRGSGGRTVVLPVYDIVNCGPRSRYVVLTAEGPVVAHNCGYFLGTNGLLEYAKTMFVTMTREQAEDAKNTYRETYWEVVELWDRIKQAAFYTVQTGKPASIPKLRFDKRGPFLRMQIPSGRHIHYFQPRVEMVEAPWSTAQKPAEIEALTYMGQNQVTRKWERTSTHPGKLVENAVQAIARDILAYGLLGADKAGLEIVGHVHDEIITHDPVDRKDALETLIECMTRVPEWAEGLPLAAEGYSTHFYKKD